jgi:hypothetical protein
VVIGISRIMDHLTSTEKVLWHRKPDPKAYSKVRTRTIPIIIATILVILSIVFLFPPFLIETIEPTNLTYIIFIIDVLGIIGLIPLIFYTRAKDAEYLITNKRVIIYSSQYAKTPMIINLSEVNGDIEMKYNKHRGTGSIYIPSPHWYRHGRLVQYSTVIMDKPIIDPDIKDIKEPYKVYNILIEAVEMGKRTKWK